MPSDADEFFRALYSGDTTGLYSLVRVPRAEDSSALWTHHQRSYHSIVNGVPQVPDFTDDDLEQFAWFYTPAVLQTQGTKEDDVKEVTTLWADFDTPERTEDLLQRLEPKPTYLVVSSTAENGKKKHHAYWMLTEAAAPTVIRPHLRWLTNKFSSDRAVTNASRLLRVPGSWNYKNGTRCQIVYRSNTRYALTDFGDVGDDDSAMRAQIEEFIPLDGEALDRDMIWAKYEQRMSHKLKRLLTESVPHTLEGSNRHGALSAIYRMCLMLGMSAEECFWLVRNTPNDKWHQDKYYRPDESLRADIMWVYGQSSRPNGGQTVLDRIAEIRTRAKNHLDSDGKKD